MDCDIYITGSNWIGLLCGALAGLRGQYDLRLFHRPPSARTIRLWHGHQHIRSGAGVVYLRIVFGTGSDLKQIITMPSIAIPGLKDIPVIGPLLFDQSPMVYLTLLLVVFTSIFFNRTRAGLSYNPWESIRRRPLRWASMSSA